jgi:hypothetical protein
MSRVRRRLLLLLALVGLLAGGRSAMAPAQTPAPPQTELLVPELASDAFSSPRLRLGWGGRGPDAERVVAFLAEVREVGLRSAADWRTLVAGSPARGAVFTGMEGEAYVVRVSTRAGGDVVFGPPAVATVVVPLDERNRRVRRSRGWRTQRRAGAWNGATAASSSTRATAKLRFTQRRVRVIVRRFPSAGRLAVTLDGRRSIVSLAGPDAARQVAFDSGRLGRGVHRLTLRPAGGRVQLDAIAVG